MQVISVRNAEPLLFPLENVACQHLVGDVDSIREKVFKEGPLDSTVSGGISFQTILQRYQNKPVRSPPSFGWMSHDYALKAALEVANHVPNAPYSLKKVDFLLERMANGDPRMHFLSEDGTYVRPESISQEFGYARMKGCVTPASAYQWTSSILRNERARNPIDRPSKIFLILGAMAGTWKPQDGINHAVVIVVEPDPRNPYNANITIVNPVGNEEHSEYEDEVIRGVHDVYCRSARPPVKNKKMQQFDLDGCGLHAVENIAILKDEPDVQGFIETGRLPDRTPDMVTEIYRMHARAARAIYEWLRNPTGQVYEEHFMAIPQASEPLREVRVIPAAEVDDLQRAISDLSCEVQKKRPSEQGLLCQKRRYNALTIRYRNLSLEDQDKMRAGLLAIQACLRNHSQDPQTNETLMSNPIVRTLVFIFLPIVFAVTSKSQFAQKGVSLFNRNIQVIQQR